MNQDLAEGQFGHGGLGHFLQPSDWKYHSLVPKGTPPFDWNEGYDVEAELSTALGIPGFTLPVENQGPSGSCGGQAVRYYSEVLNALVTKIFTRRSAKFPYAQVFQLG
jgi:hypothetical protein